MLKAVIFDIDGVLLDSLETNVKFFQLLFERAGHPVPANAELKQHFHRPTRHVIKACLPEADEVEIERVFELAKSMTWRELPEVPDGLEAVITNLAADYKLGLVSGRLNQFIGELYQLADVEHHFDVVVGFEDYTHPKPHPEPLLIAAKRLGVKAAEAVYIGDSATDKQAAEAAGMPFIFCSIQPVTWTDESSPTLDQLPELIRKL